MGCFYLPLVLFSLIGGSFCVARRSTAVKSRCPSHILGCVGNDRDSSHRRIVPSRSLVQLGPNRGRWLAHR